MSMAQGISATPRDGMAPEVKRDSHQTSSRVTTQLKDIKKTLPLRVLSQEDFAALADPGLCDCAQCGARGECRAAQGVALGI